MRGACSAVYDGVQREGSACINNNMPSDQKVCLRDFSFMFQYIPCSPRCGRVLFKILFKQTNKYVTFNHEKQKKLVTALGIRSGLRRHQVGSWRMRITSTASLLYSVTYQGCTDLLLTHIWDVLPSSLVSR